MAPLAALQVNVTGDCTPVALFAGAMSVAGALLQAAPVATVIVVREEKVEGQLSKSASTNQEICPCGTAPLSCVAPLVEPMRNGVLELAETRIPQTRSPLAPATPLHWNDTGEARP